MRTSLHEIKQAEDYLLNEIDPQDKLLFEARLILSPQLREDVLWQQQTYTLVKQYGRKKLKAELEALHQQLFTQKQHQSFAQKIKSFFGR